MAVLAIFTGRGITAAMYDALRSEVDWEHNQPDGGIFHVAGVDDSGDLRVADVWASPEALNEFVNSRVMPAMTKLNIPGPQVEVFPLHNATAYAAVDQYKI